MRRGLANTLLVAVAVILSLGAVEAALLVLAGFTQADNRGNVFRYEDLYVSNRPIATFDPVSGYRRTPGSTRIVRITHDILIFDQTFTPNNAGYISARDYTHEKPAGTARIVVLGDSFTTEEFNPQPWPDRVDAALKGRTTRPTELYSFAVNGAGLGNWSTIFFDDIVPHYQFDALVIATYVDNLARQYSYLHYDGPNAYIGFFPTRAATTEDFLANYLPRMAPHNVKVATDAEIDAMIASLRQPWQWPGFELRSGPLIAAQWQRFRSGRMRAIPAVAGPATAPGGDTGGDIAAIAAQYGPAQFGLLQQIMGYCRDHGIPVILASVPGRDTVRAFAESKGRDETPHQRETRALAAHFGALYMDGYAPFGQVLPADIDERYWLKFDGHWNQAGSNLFADAMTDFLIANQDKLVRAQTKP